MVHMSKITQMTATARLRVRNHIRHFAQAEDGVMLALVVSILLIMMMVAGFGVEVMRTEMERTRIQQVIDTSTLAAAHHDNELDPKDVVMDYFAKANLTSYIGRDDITVGDSSLATSVEVRLTANVRTPFLGQVGNDSFSIPVAGRAEQAMGNSEVSLVLDISGSMDNNNRMTRLHSAAKEFVDTVLPDGTTDRVSLSLVPYTGDVNAGWEIFNRMNVRQLHSYSYCLQFTPLDFSTTALDPDDFYIQGQHFSHTDEYFNNIPCPTQDYETITPLSQNRSALKTQIGKMTGRERTSIHIGLKWGAALLDETFAPLVEELVDDGIVDEAFRGRPASFSSNTMKVMVVMTDGENTETKRIKEFAYDTPDMRAHWARMAIDDFEDDVESSLEASLFTTYYSPALADTLMQNICTAAKNAGILIYTIGFEVNDDSAEELEDCASSPSHFYRVEGIQISDAFSSIARQLKQLRLTL